jgi:hypothetical protein
VQGARDELLAGSGFAGDEHGDTRAGETAYCTEYELHRRRVAQELLDVRKGRAFYACALVCVYRPPDESDGLVDVKWLWQIVERAGLVRREGAAQVRMRGHYDHRQLGVGVPYQAQQLETRHARQANVRNHGVRCFAFERLQCRLGGLEHARRKAVATQGTFKNPENRGIVIDEPDAGIRIIHAVTPQPALGLRIVQAV